LRNEAEHGRTPAAAGTASAVAAGSRIVSFDPSRPDQGISILTDGFSAAGKPDVSFDGKRILFVARRLADDPLDVWEMNADGSDPRRITSQVGDCSAAVYLSPIYTIDARAPAYQIAFCRDGGDEGRPALFTCRMDGSRVRRITYNPYGATEPCLLSDGRLLFCSGLPSRPGQRSDGASALFTVNTDGTDVFVFAAAHEPPAFRGMPCETAGGQVVYVESTGGGRHHGGSLVAVSRTASLHTRRVVAGDRGGLFRSPSALDDGSILVSHRPRGAGSYGVYVLDLEGEDGPARVYDAPRWHELDAVAVRARAEPDGRSSVVDERLETGLLYCLNAYLSDADHAPPTCDDRIRWLRVFGAVTDHGRETRGTSGPQHVKSAPGLISEALLGVAPVESDGSFHLSIPARTPLRLETLNADGRVIQAMRSWIWVMPREARGCIGCHEDRELSPPNRHPLALRKPPQPVGVAGPEPYEGGESRKRGRPSR
jgi:hypothetical protein